MAPVGWYTGRQGPFHIVQHRCEMWGSAETGRERRSKRNMQG